MGLGSGKKLRVLIDANTLIRGFIHPRFAFEIFNHAFKRDFDLVLLPYTVEEAVRNIAKRFPDRLPHMEEFLLKCPYELLEDPSPESMEEYKDLIRDETDLPLVTAAIKSGVNYLVTNEKDFVGQGKTTEKIQQAVSCVTAGNFLRTIMDWPSKELAIIQNRTWTDLKKN